MAKPVSPKLETVRFEIVPFVSADVDQTYVGWMHDKTVTEHIDARYVEQTIDSIKQFVDSFDQINGLFWRVKDKISRVDVGNVQARVVALHRTADVGILIGNRQYWGKGVAQEVLSSVFDYLFSVRNVEKVTMGTRKTNERMQKTIMAMGLLPEGVLKKQVRHGTGRTDICQYALFPK